MRTGRRTGAGSGAGCFDEPGPGPGQRPRRPGRRLCRRGGAGRLRGGVLRPSAAPPPGAAEPGVGRGAGRAVLVRGVRVRFGLHRLRHRGRGGGLRPGRHLLRRRGLLSAVQPPGAEAGGDFGQNLRAGVGPLRHSGPLGGAGREKNLVFFEKGLFFFRKMVYNNRETWSKVRGHGWKDDGGRRPRLV